MPDDARPCPYGSGLMPRCTTNKHTENGLQYFEISGNCSLNDKERVAKENVEASLSALNAVRANNGMIVMPAMREYVDHPSPETWKVVKDQIHSIGKVIETAKSVLVSLDPQTEQRIESELQTIAASLEHRSVMVTTLPDQPMSLDAAKTWYSDYSDTAAALRSALQSIRSKLNATS